MSRLISKNGNIAKRHIQWQQKQKQLKHHQQNFPTLKLSIAICLVTVFLNIDATVASQNLLPDLCDTVKCPPLSEIICPDDSDIRENFLPPAAALLSPLATETTSSPAQQSTSVSASANFLSSTNDEFNEELYTQCCVSKKCICRTCHIPDCDKELEFVVELVPESPKTPGQCCGQYECQKEPNCTEVRDTESYWLRDCQRCKCYSGERMCHQSCDEGMRKPPTVFCESKSLNRYFEQGEIWKEGCYECECVNGEEKCAIPFCRSVNCPTHRQVLLKDSCCPICWPKGIRMPNSNEQYDNDDEDDGDEDEDQNGHVKNTPGANQFYDKNVDDDEPIAPLQTQPTKNYEAIGNELDILLPDINFEKDLNVETTKITTEKAETTTTKQLTIMKVLLGDNTTTVAPIAEPTTATTQTTTTAAATTATTQISTTAASTTAKPQTPCMFDETHVEIAPATYKIHPEVVRQTDQSYLHYIIIGVLGLVIIILVAWNVNLRHKQRSYRPVSNFDDNFNKMSSNIKKMNDYV